MKYLLILLIAAPCVAQTADKAEKAFLKVADESSVLERVYAHSTVMQVQKGVHKVLGWKSVDKFIQNKDVSSEVWSAYNVYKRAVKSDPEYLKQIQAKKVTGHISELADSLSTGNAYKAKWIIKYYAASHDPRFKPLRVKYSRLVIELRGKFDPIMKQFLTGYTNGNLTLAKSSFKMLAEYKLFENDVNDAKSKLLKLESYDKYIAQTEDFTKRGHLKAARRTMATATGFATGGTRTEAIASVLKKKTDAANKKADKLIKAIKLAIKAKDLMKTKNLMKDLWSSNKLNGEHPEHRMLMDELRELIKSESRKERHGR